MKAVKSELSINPEQRQTESPGKRPQGLDSIYAHVRRIEARLLHVEKENGILRTALNRIERRQYRESETFKQPSYNSEGPRPAIECFPGTQIAIPE